jgi:cbb3-type cytochrome oxidase subunit 1
MHSIIRRFLKTAVGFLAAGIVIGLVMLVRRELQGAYPGPFTTSAHTHAILVGFVMLMIMGVAAWMFPRPGKSDDQYRPGLVELAYWCVTIGTVIRVAGELVRAVSAAPALRVGVVLGGAGQAAGILLFFYTMWTRIRPAGSRAREEQGERF